MMEYPSFWEKMTPGQQRLARVLAWLLVPGFLLSVFIDPWAALVWLWVCGVYWGWKLIKFTLHLDRMDREHKKFEQSFRDELGHLEEKLREMPHPRIKKKDEKPKVINSHGDPMVCIICGEFTNERGRFCDAHDEWNEFYKRPGE